MSDKLVPSNRIVMFNDHAIRRTMHNNEWWFVIVDVISVLTESRDPANYYKDMRRRDPDLFKSRRKPDQLLWVVRPPLLK
jgi:DNA-damage-inducible protein D